MSYFSLIFAWMLLIIPGPRITVLGIIGGTRTQHYPFFVSLELPSKLCGGTLIASDAVLTSANCLFYEQSNRWLLNQEVQILKSDFSKLNWQKQTRRYSCERYIVHQSYNPYMNDGLGPFDIAVIKLTACVGMRNPKNGILQLCPASMEYAEGFAIGMGLDRRDNDMYSEVLIGAWMYRYFPCQTFYLEDGLYIDETKQVCYGSEGGYWPTGTCDGDYGGPIFHKNLESDKAICLIGVASFNLDSCMDPMVPSVFTRANYFGPWIAETVEKLSSTSTKSFCTISK